MTAVRRHAQPLWVPFPTSWFTNCENYGGGNTNCAYRYDPETERVELQGIVKVTTTPGYTITLGAHVRPPAFCMYPGAGGGAAVYALRMDITSGGAISVQGASLVVNDYFTLNGISFYRA